MPLGWAQGSGGWSFEQHQCLMEQGEGGQGELRKGRGQVEVLK